MKLVADTNVFLAVALNEPEKAALIKATSRSAVAAPTILPFEVGNALSAMVKRGRLRATQALEVWDVVSQIPVELVIVDVAEALGLAVRFEIYAYDAYFLQCALQLRCPLLTLDRALARVATELDLVVTELP